MRFGLHERTSDFLAIIIAGTIYGIGCGILGTAMGVAYVLVGRLFINPLMLGFYYIATYTAINLAKEGIKK